MVTKHSDSLGLKVQYGKAVQRVRDRYLFFIVGHTGKTIITTIWKRDRR